MSEAEDISAIRATLEAIARSLGVQVRHPSNPEAMAEFAKQYKEKREAEIQAQWEARQAQGKTDEMDEDDVAEFGEAWMG